MVEKGRVRETLLFRSRIRDVERYPYKPTFNGQRRGSATALQDTPRHTDAHGSADTVTRGNLQSQGSGKELDISIR